MSHADCGCSWRDDLFIPACREHLDDARLRTLAASQRHANVAVPGNCGHPATRPAQGDRFGGAA